MKTSISQRAGTLLGLLFLITAAPAFAQSASTEPSPSGNYCITIAGEPPVMGWDAITLAEAVRDGTAVITYVDDAGACGEPTPTEEPTPEPTEVAGTEYLDYLTTVSPEILNVADWLDRVATHAGDGSLRQLKNDFAHIKAISTRVLRYLNSHDPQPCYETLHADTRRIFTLLLSSANHGIRGLNRYSAAEINRSADLLNEATDLMVEVTDSGEIDEASATCADSPGNAG